MLKPLNINIRSFDWSAMPLATRPLMTWLAAQAPDRGGAVLGNAPAPYTLTGRWMIVYHTCGEYVLISYIFQHGIKMDKIISTYFNTMNEYRLFLMILYPGRFHVEIDLRIGDGARMRTNQLSANKWQSLSQIPSSGTPNSTA